VHNYHRKEFLKILQIYRIKLNIIKIMLLILLLERIIENLLWG